MKRATWMLGLSLSVGCLAALSSSGCGDDGSSGGSDGGGGDMVARADDGGATGDDLAKIGDLATTPPRAYDDSSAHAIDTASPSGTLVRLRGVVVTTPVTGGTVKRTGGPAAEYFCRYSMWVQDPTCTTAPCGILLRTESPVTAAPTACPRDAASTLLGALAPGDNVDVEGATGWHDSRDPAGGAGLTREHFVTVDRASAAAGTPKTIDDVVISDDATLAAFAKFSTAADQSWQRYEGMRVRLEPAGGFVTVDNGLAWTTTPNGTPFAISFLARPSAGTKLSSAAGVVAPGYGGVMFPVQAGDLIVGP
jgi:hypothetical protein